MIVPTHQIRDGLESWGLRSNDLQIEIVPALGAKVISLRHRRGREWMWSPHPTLRLFKVPRGATYAEGPTCGLDECLPTVAACHWRGRSLPDHGEAWNEAWTFDEAAHAMGILKTQLQLPLSPLSFERAVSLEGDRLIFRYSIKNTSDEAYEYLWALHPLLRIEAGDRLRLPAEVRQVRTDSSLHCALGLRGTEWDWATPPDGMDIAALDFGGKAAAVKFFTAPLSEGRARLENAQTGEFFQVEFNPVELPSLGVWVNRGGWAGYHHVALEPTNGAPDALDAAVETWKRFTRLPPGQTRSWSLTITVGPRRSPGVAAPSSPRLNAPSQILS